MNNKLLCRFGVQLSWLECLNGVQEAGGSSPLIPTKDSLRSLLFIIKNTGNRHHNFTKYNSSVKREEFKEKTSQSLARTQFASSPCSLYILPHFQCGSFPLPISSAEFILFIPTHYPMSFFICIKILIDNHCIFLYVIDKYYKGLFFLQEKDYPYGRERDNDI